MTRIWVLICQSAEGRGIVHYCSQEPPTLDRLNELRMLGGTVTEFEVIAEHEIPTDR